jgi:hypothetical protein
VASGWLGLPASLYFDLLTERTNLIMIRDEVDRQNMLSFVETGKVPMKVIRDPGLSLLHNKFVI